jgi:hypothetical protein
MAVRSGTWAQVSSAPLWPPANQQRWRGMTAGQMLEWRVKRNANDSFRNDIVEFELKSRSNAAAYKAARVPRGPHTIVLCHRVKPVGAARPGGWGLSSSGTESRIERIILVQERCGRMLDAWPRPR